MTISDFLTSSGKHPDRVVKWPATQLMLSDAQVLANRVTQLLSIYCHRFIGKKEQGTAGEEEPAVRSGYRPPEVNAVTPHAAKNSNHMYCRAVDIEDAAGELSDWCLKNLDLLEHLELWMESPKYTLGWCHLQSVPPHSNHRVFVP